MILFLDEDRAYLNWVTHHRTGFVLDCLRHPTKAHLKLHRATCPEIKQSGSKRTHWTTGRHMKGCAVDSAQLQAWALDQVGCEAGACPQCTPDREPAADEPHAEMHLTRLDQEILSAVLDIAACHLDDDDHAYALTVGGIGRCLDKTEGQLAAALARLVEGGLLRLGTALAAGKAPAARCGVWPTAGALRTLEYYAGFSDQQLAAELERLVHV